jgi:sensor histidine kinase YesM
MGLAFVFQSFIFNANNNQGFNWQRSLIYSLSNYWLWAFITPLIYFLAKKFPLDRQRFGRYLLIHFSLSLLIAPLHRFLSIYINFVVQDTLGYLRRSVPEMLNVAKFGIIGGSIDSLIIYWIILIVVLGVNYYQKYQQHRLASIRLKEQLTQAQLQALRMQVHPHFLFNTLHAISTLVEENPAAARQMIARLGDLLRLSLENNDAPEVTLKQEMEFLQRYLAIEQVRFQDRLQVNLEIAPETLDARVPNLILQPIVENAIRHGIAPHSRAGKIDIRAWLDNGVLQLEVQDNGKGIPAEGNLYEGIGLKNTRSRLEQLYGNNQQLHLQNVDTGGLLVQLCLPFQTNVKPIDRQNEN